MVLAEFVDHVRSPAHATLLKYGKGRSRLASQTIKGKILAATSNGVEVGLR